MLNQDAEDDLEPGAGAGLGTGAVIEAGVRATMTLDLRGSRAHDAP